MKENGKKTTQNRVTKQMRNRALVVACAFVFVCFGAVVFNLFNVQIIEYEKYKAKASAVQLRDTQISAKRGTIYDANMKVLAQSATVWTVFVSPAEVKDTPHELIASGLSQILEVDHDIIMKKLANKSSYYEIIKYKVDKPVADKVRLFCTENDISGVNLIEDFKRYYPYGSFAASILGFCGTDNQGLAGLENYYNDELTGVKGRVISAKNGVGLDMGVDYKIINEAQDGYSLVTTIDETVQHYLEKQLSYAAQEHNVAERSVGIVMNVKTGAILGMATKPDFDPNDPFTIQDQELAAAINAITDETERKTANKQAREKQWNNKAVTELYEPGSVFKVVTASAALDSGACNLHSTFHCSGSVRVADALMRCAQSGGHGHENFSQALMNSCNPAFIDIGQRMGAQTFYDYFYSFGLTEKTGIDLPGEQKSIYYKAEDLGTVELASTSFGQSSKITAIQMITAVATAVNGGQLVVPHLVEKLVDANGNIVEDLTPEPKRQVISSQVSEQISKILQDNVNTPAGHGKNAYVAGYRVGGKSGTSQKLDKKNQNEGKEVYVASFVGFAPADGPEIAILIILDEPHSPAGYYGGVLSGPVVGALMGEILPYLGIEANYTEAEQSNTSVSVPSITDMSLVDAQVKLQRLGFSVKSVGSGTRVISQFPTYGMTISKGGVVIAYTDAQVQSAMVSVPNLIGKSPQAATSALAALGLNCRGVGAWSGGSVQITKQSINAGDKVPMGTVITLTGGATGIID